MLQSVPIFVAPWPTCSRMSTYFCSWGAQIQTQHCIGSHQCWIDEKDHTPWPASLGNPGCSWPSLPCRFIAGSWVTGWPAGSPGSFSAKLKSSWPGSSLNWCMGLFRSYTGLCNSLGWTSWGSGWPIYVACWGLSERHHTHLVYQSPLYVHFQVNSSN